MSMTDDEKKRHFQNALSNYMPVLGIIDSFEDKGDEAFPTEWTDPLDLYGRYCRELVDNGLDLETEREAPLRLLEEKDPDYIWSNRRRLVAERIFIHNF